MKSKLVFAIGIVLAIAIPVISFAASFGTQNFFYAPGNVITPLAGFTTSWNGSSQTTQPFLSGNAVSALPQTMAQFSTSTLNSFAQAVFWNTNGGNNASTDLVFNDASSTQNAYFAEFGEDGANYSQSAFSGESAHDLYAMSSDASVDIETASTTCNACAFKVFTAGTTAAQLRLNVASSGLATFYNGIQSNASSTVGGGTQATGLTINGGATTTANVNITGNSSLNITGSGQINMTNGGSWAALIAQGSDSILRITNGGNTRLSITSGGLFIYNGAAPTAATSTGSGTGSVPVTINGNANDFSFSITTGTSPTGSNATIATFTLTASCTNNNFPQPTPSNAAADALTSTTANPFASSASVNTFTLKSGATALTAATTYTWNFHVGCY